MGILCQKICEKTGVAIHAKICTLIKLLAEIGWDFVLDVNWKNSFSFKNCSKGGTAKAFPLTGADSALVWILLSYLAGQKNYCLKLFECIDFIGPEWNRYMRLG